MGSVLFNIGLSRNFSGSVSLGKGKKSKSKQMELHQTKKFVHSQGNHQQNKILLTVKIKPACIVGAGTSQHYLVSLVKRLEAYKKISSCMKNHASKCED